MPYILWKYPVPRAPSQLLAVGRWFPPGTPVSSTRKLISSSFHRLDMTLAVAEALTPNKLKPRAPKCSFSTSYTTVCWRPEDGDRVQNLHSNSNSVQLLLVNTNWFLVTNTVSLNQQILAELNVTDCKFLNQWKMWMVHLGVPPTVAELGASHIPTCTRPAMWSFMLASLVIEKYYLGKLFHWKTESPPPPEKRGTKHTQAILHGNAEKVKSCPGGCGPVCSL